MFSTTTLAKTKSDFELKQYENQNFTNFWKNYSDYKLILLIWMLNDGALVWAVTELSHSGFYVHAFLHSLSIVLIGIPLVYTEICLSQYTNCTAITLWKFLPLFRCVGFGSIYLVILRTIFTIILTTWYLTYTIHAALDPPPWFTCADFIDMNITNCMIKRVNVSVFQHCLETQNLYGEDCGMKTASHCFFEREIGNFTTLIWPKCMPGFKAMCISCALGLMMFILTLRRRFLVVGVKLVLMYVAVVTFILFCVALSYNGTWYASKNSISWPNYNWNNCLVTVTRAFLSLGTGTGMIKYLSRKAAFRSPATMTSITIPLLSIFITLMFSLIAFSGIKTMSYYHGEEENVIELGDNYYFSPFASISEIMTYFDAMPIWSFAWFSSVFSCMFVQLWLLFGYLKEIVLNSCEWAQTHPKTSTFTIIISLLVMAYPCFCSDVSPAILDVIDLIQLFGSFVFSFSIYWIYGYKKHNVDIIFMLGIKANYFWKIAWILNPLLVFCLFYTKYTFLAVGEYDNSHIVESLEMEVDVLFFYVLIGIYVFILIIAFIIQVLMYFHDNRLKDLFIPDKNWGPGDNILLKSRNMFVPEIMTREFLYRQVKIHGYYRKRQRKVAKKEEHSNRLSTDVNQTTEWSASTSN